MTGEAGGRAPREAPAAESSFARFWRLDPDVSFLNHGSFGACPVAVLERQAELRDELEREPVDFLVRRLPERLAEVRAVLGGFLGAEPDDLAFVPNATTGVNAVLGSLDLNPGDELLTTTHAYPGCRNALAHACARTGARLVVADVPFPLEGEDEVVAPVLAAVSPRTRLALLDHVTSPTALVFPIERLVGALRERGVETLVDGAHAPGMVPVDLDRLGAGWYTGNAHKWLCSPKGAAFLHVREDLQTGARPAVTSLGYSEVASPARFRAEFDWTGTCDPTPWLTIPAALDALASLLPGGWSEVMTRNRALALEARDVLGETLRVSPAAPAEMIGSMASVPLPMATPGSVAARLGPQGLGLWLRERSVETWLYPWPSPGGMLVRVSAQLYNAKAEYERLGALLAEALVR